ncbi:hypothetical protein HII31_05827 [Pseudocercospora fuligena]|uniref:Phosphoglycerate mutase n=1 Tax=Pseudocercospora fuligena TaxID=685502 RepID=A0A8H6RKS9_9PEZI|nr:hypothetical protein HII31_05827 [Pseudocercospora fuligena]
MTAAQPPAVVIIARHGMRLDAADQSWHLSTPTPYDPPLTYGGWNQCRALGVRIASLLDAREKEINSAPVENGHGGAHPQRRRKRKHKVVIHTSPFLRCLQTSVAISAGMAQYEAPKERPGSSKSRTPSQLHSKSPRLHGLSGSGSPVLTPISEPKHDLAHQLAKRSLHEHKRHRKAKIRVDAFLGEWLNPQYFDQITPPPPSAMMVAAAKAELMQNDTIHLFTPSATLSNKSSNNSLWSRPNTSRESTLDDWSNITDSLRASGGRKSRSNSIDSVGSNDSNHSPRSSGRKLPFRPGHVLQPMTSTIPKPEFSVYHPPMPSYALSNSDQIPRGYVAHARNATTNVDYHWDSSRAPLDWGGGGEFGEEWSSMHKRFRRGFNKAIEWYSQHDADDRGEDALGFEQAERPHIYHGHDDEDEDLVVVMVTHGAGSNALIGALTNQPVLLDVGMASLTMAVRKDNAPSLQLPLGSPALTPDPTGTPSQSPDPAAMAGHRRRSSLDIGLSAVYEMKLVASSEHLRAGADPAKQPASSVPQNLKAAQEALARYKQFGAEAHGMAGSGIESNWNLGEPKKNNFNSSLGSIRRPSYPNNGARSYSQPGPAAETIPPAVSPGLWTPPAGGTPILNAQKVKEEKAAIFSKLNDTSGRTSPGRDMMLDFSSSQNGSRPNTATESTALPSPALPRTESNTSSEAKTDAAEKVDSVTGEGLDEVRDLPKVQIEAPTALSRGLSVKGLWGRPTGGDKVVRNWRSEPKRRWTVNEND